MKKLLAILLVSCAGQQESVVVPPTPTDTPAPTEVPTPTPTPTPTEVPSVEVSDELKEVVVHEFGHALGLLHPFDSLLPEAEECKKVLRTYGIEDSGIAEEVRKYYPEYYKDWDTFYDSSSIMNYQFCRSTTGYHPSFNDLIEASILLQVFEGEPMYLYIPILPDTINFFRRSADIPVCINERVTDYQRGALKSLVKVASEEWGLAGWNIHFEESCSNSDNEIRLGVLPYPEVEGTYVAGNSSLGLTGKDDDVNMRIALSKEER